MATFGSLGTLVTYAASTFFGTGQSAVYWNPEGSSTGLGGGLWDYHVVGDWATTTTGTATTTAAGTPAWLTNTLTNPAALATNLLADGDASPLWAAAPADATIITLFVGPLAGAPATGRVPLRLQFTTASGAVLALLPISGSAAPYAVSNSGNVLVISVADSVAIDKVVAGPVTTAPDVALAGFTFFTTGAGASNCLGLLEAQLSNTAVDTSSYVNVRWAETTSTVLTVPSGMGYYNGVNTPTSPFVGAGDNLGVTRPLGAVAWSSVPAGNAFGYPQTSLTFTAPSTITACTAYVCAGTINPVSGGEASVTILGPDRAPQAVQSLTHFGGGTPVDWNVTVSDLFAVVVDQLQATAAAMTTVLWIEAAKVGITPLQGFDYSAALSNPSGADTVLQFIVASTTSEPPPPACMGPQCVVWLAGGDGAGPTPVTVHHLVATKVPGAPVNLLDVQGGVVPCTMVRTTGAEAWAVMCRGPAGVEVSCTHLVFVPRDEAVAGDVVPDEPCRVCGATVATTASEPPSTPCGLCAQFAVPGFVSAMASTVCRRAKEPCVTWYHFVPLEAADRDKAVVVGTAGKWGAELLRRPLETLLAHPSSWHVM
jgi:hypothetical protein